ncbi:MAG TPA: OadG family protein [Caldisericia bacterium]|jgi:sodium pump decarboxylase gamma subunit|nr:OadG family protein [Caldisericia bacterium]HXK51113.1 OadG family protein [Caldisericia bacterium]
MIYEGVSILLSGMGTVFLFLILLIATVMGMSAVTIKAERRSKKELTSSLHHSYIAALTAIAFQQREKEGEA